ncbi:flavodoxin [Streptomyces sp. SCUT-3]|uniref:flavodoxin domain-containing protein n=1 Tax=Streptomyces TaxID=1883 RepID=UPI000CB82590|nr:flavodoxin domain-containing protein [Streptomyces sp. SCUT-3]PLW62906.1 flavodoxin [Streptomyces sp. DJ]QMV24539.1 flavodoxin [Streptomyces sp. SCUT-3]
MTVLVGHAGRHGSTRGIAERIGERLAGHGERVEVRPLDGAVDPGGYEAFVLGSAVYDMAWLPEAADFVRRGFGAGRTPPVWLFSVGAADALGLPLRSYAARKEEGRLFAYLTGLRPGLHPRSVRLFSGAVAREHLPPAGRLFLRATGGRYGDHRNWPEIDAWADSVARELAAGAARP